MSRYFVAVLAALFMVSGSVAVVGNDAPGDKPSITSDPGEAADKAADKVPDDIPGNASNRAGMVNGISNAISNAPDRVAESVLKPISNGVTGLGNLFDLGSLLGSPENASQPENMSGNMSS